MHLDQTNGECGQFFALIAIIHSQISKGASYYKRKEKGKRKIWKTEYLDKQPNINQSASYAYHYSL